MLWRLEGGNTGFIAVESRCFTGDGSCRADGRSRGLGRLPGG